MSEQDPWLEMSIERESDRRDLFIHIRALTELTSWFHPRWRRIMIIWYHKVAPVYGLCPVTLENALFFLDSFLAACMKDGKKLTVADYQIMGMVSLLVSSKMYGAVPHVRVADIVRMAPQLRIKPRDVCVMELQLIQTLQFDLFVPTTTEFSHAFISRLERRCTQAARLDTIDLTPLRAWVNTYTKYLDFDFTALEFRQSEKAAALVNCALARWSLMDSPITSSADESRALALRLDALEGTRMYPEAHSFTASQQVNALWRHTLESLKDPNLVCAGRRRTLEARVVAGLASDVDMVYSPQSVAVESVDPRDDLPKPASPKLIRCQPLRPGAHEEGVETLSRVQRPQPQGSCATFSLIKECATVTPDDVGDTCSIENGDSLSSAAELPCAKRRLEGNFEKEPPLVALELQRSGSGVKRAK